MPKPLKNKIVQCRYFAWRLYQRKNGPWYADGRSKEHDLGRKTLESTDWQEATKNLVELDRISAERLGLAPRKSPPATESAPLTLAEGRTLHEKHIGQPGVTGGLAELTRKKYRSHYDKFITWASSRHIRNWNDVDAAALREYAAYLKAGGPNESKKAYSDKSISNELTFFKGLIRWLIGEGYLAGMEPIKLKVAKPESQRPHCYTGDQVAAMIAHCRANPAIGWLADIIVALACTGLRISELAGLRWSDLDLDHGKIVLTRQAAYRKPDAERRSLKSKRSRTFPIAPELLATLKRLPRNADGYVFHGPRGGRIKDDWVRRMLIAKVLNPLKEQFPSPEGEGGFADGRLHSFRHYFCSVCANSDVPELMLKQWLGHRDSEMVRHYYHLYDGEARRRMNAIDFLGERSGGTAGRGEEQRNEEPPGEQSA